MLSSWAWAWAMGMHNTNNPTDVGAACARVSATLQATREARTDGETTSPQVG